MKQLVDFSLMDGGSVLVEVDEPQPEGGIVPAARSSDIFAKTGRCFDAALEKVRPAAEALMSQLQGMSRTPDKIEVEFGIKLNADAGAFIASTGAEANFKVTLMWENSKSERMKLPQ